MLDIQSDDEDYSGAGEQEVDADMAFEDADNPADIYNLHKTDG